VVACATLYHLSMVGYHFGYNKKFLKNTGWEIVLMDGNVLILLHYEGGEAVISVIQVPNLLPLLPNGLP